MALQSAVQAVLLPRYMTLGGDTTFRTLPLNVVPYRRAELVAWRGPIPSGCSFRISLEVSNDQTIWEEIAFGDPGANSEMVMNNDLSRAWLRAVVLLSGVSAFPVATCYLVGALILRGT